MTFRLIPFVLLAGASPAAALDPEATLTAEDMIAHAKDYYGTGEDSRDCAGTATEGEILVCGKRKRPPPRIDPPDRDTAGPEAKMVALGSSPVPHLGGGVTMRGCFLQKCPKELYFIDVSALPEPAPDTDADRIAKGEMRAH